MVVQKELKAAHKNAIPISTGKENMPPPSKTKRIVSISTLFEQKHTLRRKAAKDAEDILAPRSGGVFKRYAGTQRTEQHQLYRKFLSATKDYRDGFAGGKGEQLEPVYNELVARVDELAVSRMSADGKDINSAAQINALVAEHARLANPLGEDKIEIQRTKTDGSTVGEERKLADTMKAFEHVLNQKRDELEQLLQELKDVDVDIAATRQDILAVEEKEVKQLNSRLDAEIAALMQKADMSAEATLSEVDRARKDEKKAAEIQNKKFEDFMNSI